MGERVHLRPHIANMFQEEENRNVCVEACREAKRDLDLCDFLTLSFAALSAAAVFSSILLLAGTSWGDVPFSTPTTSLQVKRMFA